MLISDEYRHANAEMHAQKAHYGSNGHRNAKVVRDLLAMHQCATVLDYGCGKGTLAAALRTVDVEVNEYDPAIPGKDHAPFPADLVACTDVLEHIEPECLGEVLDDLRRLTRKVLFVAVHTGPAAKTLPDGRNAHLIQQPPSWWLPQLQERMALEYFQRGQSGFMAVLTPHV